MKKRILSLLCVLALCLGPLPVTALAAGDHGSHSDGWTELTADTTTLSGGSYYLSGDVEYTGAESITVSGEVILCLNGQKLNLNGQHISVSNGASLTLCDCSTGGVLTGGSGSNGGGVYVDGGGTFTMTGGSIVGNTANAGGGVYVYKGGTFTMEGGSISNNTATSGGGGGVMVYEGTFTLSGGSITGNATNNETYGYGGGVCLYGTFYLSGDVIIQGNTKAGTDDNLYLGWQTINITGPLGKNANIGVTAESVPRSFISGWSDNMAGEDPANYFSSDSDSWSIGMNTAGEVVLGSQSTTITLQPNGGTLPEYSLVEGAALPIPSRIGYTFAGWYGNPEFTGDPVTDVPTGSTVNLTFYAAWTPNTYTVTFDANGGSASQTSAVTVAGKLTSLPTPTYDGHNFLGWYTDKDGGDQITTDTVFTKDTTIYAHWQNIPVTSVTLNKTELSLFTGESQTLTATVEPETATDKSVTWERSNPDVATVEDGTVTAKGAGEATITATANDGSGQKASCTVTVTDKTYTITVDPAKLDFDAAYLGYKTQPAPQTVTITNTGNQQVTVTLPTATDFVIKEGNGFASGSATIKPGNTATFTVQPKADLAVGSYEETINISGSNGNNKVSTSVDATFAVVDINDTSVDNKLTITSGISAGISGTAFDTADKVKAELTRVLVQDAAYTAGNTAFYDVKLQYSLDNGKTWFEATEATFPTEDITVTLPYPGGTGKDTYNFRVVHMFTVTSTRLGTTAGNTETPAVTKTDSGLQVTLKGLSPVVIGWDKIETPSSTSSATSAPADDTTYYTCPSCGYHDWTATEAGYRCDNCGYLESTKQLSGYGNVKGTYTPGSGATSTAASTVPQTGDESNPVLWMVLLLVSGLALGGLAIAKRKNLQ